MHNRAKNSLATHWMSKREAGFCEAVNGNVLQSVRSLVCLLALRCRTGGSFEPCNELFDDLGMLLTCSRIISNLR